MSDLNIILLSALFGIVGAIIGYTIISFILEPVKDFRKEVRLLNTNFMKYKGALSVPNPGEFNQEASQAFKSANISLQSKILAIPMSKFLHFLRLIPHEDDVENTIKSLRVISVFIIYKGSKGEFKTYESAVKTIMKEKAKVVKYLKIKTFKTVESDDEETEEK